MPLKDRDRTRPRRLVRSGIIRLGHKETKTKKRRDGTTYEVTYPVQDDHFLLHDAPDIAEVYGDEPRELDVILPFPDIARNFDAFYKVWAGGVLVCKGDGEYVLHAGPFRVEEKGGQTRVYNASGDTLVSDGQAQIAFEWNGQEFKPGDLIPCSGAAQDLYPHCAACRKSAILKVMMAKPELIRFGYYQVATGSGRNYDTILGTLELISGEGQLPVSGIVFKMRLVKEATTYTEKGKRKATKKWFLQLEPEPALVRALYQQKAQVLLGATVDAKTDPITGEVIDEWEEVEPEAPPPFAEDGGPAEGPEPETRNGDAPRYDPAQIRLRLRNNSKWTKGEADDFSDAKRQPDDEQEPPHPKLVQRLAAMMDKALQRPEGGNTDLERHSALDYLFGIDSTGLLTALEAAATAKWLQAADMAWVPSGVAAEECRLVLREAMKDAGQQELNMGKNSEGETE